MASRGYKVIGSPRRKASMGEFGWLLPFGVLLVAIVAVPMRVLDHQGLPRYRALLDEVREIRAANGRLVRDVRDLTRQVRDLRTDHGAIESIARDELGMVHEDEIVFQFRDR